MRSDVDCAARASSKCHKKGSKKQTLHSKSVQKVSHKLEREGGKSVETKVKQQASSPFSVRYCSDWLYRSTKVQEVKDVEGEK